MPVPNGYAYQNPTYQPAMRLITSITQGYPSLVTTSFDHNYQTGDIVRLFIPFGFGMVQADNLVGTITVTGPTTFAIDIDTYNFDPFVPVPGPTVFPIAQPQVVPIGEINSKLSQATRNVLGD